MDSDLRSVQQARDLLVRAHKAQKQYASFSQEQVDRIVDAMVEAGANEAARLGQEAHDETGFGKAESKLRAAMDKKCGGGDRSCGTGGDDDSLASIGWPGAAGCSPRRPG